MHPCTCTKTMGVLYSFISTNNSRAWWHMEAFTAQSYPKSFTSPWANRLDNKTVGPSTTALVSNGQVKIEFNLLFIKSISLLSFCFIKLQLPLLLVLLLLHDFHSNTCWISCVFFFIHAQKRELESSNSISCKDNSMWYISTTSLFRCIWYVLKRGLVREVS